MEDDEEFIVMKETLPSFYYKIDDDKIYNSDEIKDLCTDTHNEAIRSSVKRIGKHFNAPHMKNFVGKMREILAEEMINMH